MNYGLALSGGGARGAAHVGILKALDEADLLPSSIAGTSAGSIVAGLYASGINVDELCEIVAYLTKHGIFLLDPDYFGLLKFIPQTLIGREVSLTGLLKGNRLLKMFHQLTGGIQISEAKTKLLIPAVDIKSGQTIVYTNMPQTSQMENVIWERQAFLSQVMMASASVPAVFCPRRISGYCLVDGGVTNNLPVNLLIGTGQKKVIAVDIGVDYQTPHEQSITEIVSHSFSIMSHNLKDCMSQGELMLLKPPLKKGAGLLTFSAMKDCMNGSYEYMKKEIPRMKHLLEKG